jgi:hypothetical protein
VNPQRERSAGDLAELAQMFSTIQRGGMAVDQVRLISSVSDREECKG